MLEELVSGPDWEPGGKLLVDHSELNAGPITADEVGSLADKAMRLREHATATLHCRLSSPQESGPD